MSAFSVENPHDGEMFENYTRFEWGVEVGVVTIFILRLFVPHEFDMSKGKEINSHFGKLLKLPIAKSISEIITLYLVAYFCEEVELVALGVHL